MKTEYFYTTKTLQVYEGDSKVFLEKNLCSIGAVIARQVSSSKYCRVCFVIIKKNLHEKNNTDKNKIT